MGDVFNGPRPGAQKRRKAFLAAAEQHPECFATADAAAEYFNRLTVPQSRRWAYRKNEKCGTSTTLRFLFELEFGVPLTVALTLPYDSNPEAAAHYLGLGDVFRSVGALGQGMEGIPDALRLTTVRDPANRAVSAFLYLCRSQDASHQLFVSDRMRMNALVGFDWNTEMRTAEGFEKFLRYTQATIEAAGYEAVNHHWRPQVENIKPDFFHPDLVGRTENLGAFFHEVAERLDQPLPDMWREPAIANRGDATHAREQLITREARRLIGEIYAEDFNRFGYQGP